MTNEWDDAEVEEEVDDDGQDLGPGDADFDLSEEHGYTWEPARIEVIPRWLLVGLSLLLVAALVFPALYIVWLYS